MEKKNYIDAVTGEIRLGDAVIKPTTKYSEIHQYDGYGKVVVIEKYKFASVDFDTALTLEYGGVSVRVKMDIEEGKTPHVQLIPILPRDGVGDSDIVSERFLEYSKKWLQGALGKPTSVFEGEKSQSVSYDLKWGLVVCRRRLNNRTEDFFEGGTVRIYYEG